MANQLIKKKTQNAGKESVRPKHICRGGLEGRLASARTPEQVAEIIFDAADAMFGWGCALQYFYSPRENRVYPVAIIDTLDGKRVKFPVYYVPQRPTYTMAKVVKKGAQLIVRNPDDMLSHGLVPYGDTDRLCATIMAAPIRNNRRIVGIIMISSYTHYAYNRKDLERLEKLAARCGEVFERVATQAALRGNEEKLRALAARLQSVREEESIRIAREIHDQMGQAMTGLKMGLMWLHKKLEHPEKTKIEPLLERIQSMVQVTDETTRNIRKICSELRPAILDDLGLEAAVNWYTREFESRTGIRCGLSLPRKRMVIDGQRATAVFRIFQEALTNIARHSEATAAWIRLEKNKNGVHLLVRDNGRGIAEHQVAAAKSLGLLGMRERVQVFGGTINVWGTPRRGTRVLAKIPL